MSLDVPFTFGCEVEYNGSSGCDYCEGEGRSYCYDCDGEGRHECSECYGEGVTTRVESDGSEEELDCTECDSSGYVSCDECEGSGYMSCPECEGEPDYDASAHCPPGWDWDGEHCGTEFRSGIETDVSRMMSHLRSLASARRGSGVSDCGFHIHLCVNPDQPGAVNPFLFFRRWQEHKEERIYPLVPKGVASRHSTQWCKRVGSDTTFTQWAEGRDRYQEINPCSMSAHGTIEVRLGGSSESGDELCAFLEAVLSLANECRYREDQSPEDRIATLRLFGLGQFTALGNLLTNSEWRLAHS